jgi:integrase
MRTVKMNDRKNIRVGSVQVQIYPWTHPKGHDYWRWDYVDPKTGGRRQVTSATQEGLAKKIATQLHGGPSEVELPTTVKARLARILAVDPLLTHYADLIEWMDNKGGRHTLKETVDEFMAAKRANRGLSGRNVRSLDGDLKDLMAGVDGSKPIASITVHDLEAWMTGHKDKSPRRRRNLRSSAVTLFRWARRRKYLPHELTAAEMLESPRVTRKIQETYTPKQMAAMMAACPVPYLPWLIFSAFHGLRYSELFPPYKSDKSPLDWSDVDRSRGLIIVRPETSKLAERRVIKLQPHAADWLPNTATGRVTPEKPPDKVHKLGKSVTTILGDLVGGWKSNALRNSFISYRAAQVGLAMTAMEAGNSESEARRSYHDAKSKEEGDAWFAILENGPQIEAGEIAS